MNKIRMIIIEDNIDLIDILEMEIKTGFSDKFEIIGHAVDGRSGLDLVLEKKPDVVLLDITLPYFDGLIILEEIDKTKAVPKCLFFVISSITDVRKINEAYKKGVISYFLKPFDTKIMLNKIYEKYSSILKENGIIVSTEKQNKIVPIEQNEKLGLSRFISKAVIDAGISQKKQGFSYICHAVFIGVESRENIECLSKTLYPCIAKRFGKSTDTIGRSIRYSIDSAWQTRTLDGYFKLMNYDLHMKPSNESFIRAIVEYVEKNYLSKF